MRPTASIVIPVWNEWEHTRACLETLRPTLGLRDEVIVVDNGSEDGTAEGLRRYRWVKVVTHEENKGFAAGCNAGGSIATGDVVVYLNNDTLVPARWLDGLLAPFADPTVGGTGPRSNFVSGPQVVEQASYDPTRVADLQRFARAWRQEHRGQTTETHRLVGFCLAVRRELVEQLGGFDEDFGIGGCEDDDLCLRIIGTGHRLLIAHESFVHHHGHATFEGNAVDWFAIQTDNLKLLEGKHAAPAREVDQRAVLLSACMIVKDEEENLPACLEALRGVVDEVVVYDTGSSDRTVEIARAAGAVVVEGYWDNDFGRARNASLEHCRGTWVLHVDADEIVQGDAAALRAYLPTAQQDTFSITIDNLASDGSIMASHRTTRLFRRSIGRWVGRLHEQVFRTDGKPMVSGVLTQVTLLHSGYTDEVMEGRGKLERNLRAARLDVEDTGGTAPLPLLNLARALHAAHRLEEALAQLERMRPLTQDRAILRNALRVGAEILLSLGRPHEALEWIGQLRRHTGSSSMPDYLEGIAHLNTGQSALALECFARLEAVSDEELDVAAEDVELRRGLVLSAAGRWAEAAPLLASAAEVRGGSLPVWAPLVEAHLRTGRPLGPVVAGVPDDQVILVLGQCLVLPVESALGIAEAFWTATPASRPVVAFVQRLAPIMSVTQALEWSARFRESGLQQFCPLAALAAGDAVAPLARLQACAVLQTGMQDERGAALLPAAAAAVAEDAFLDALLALDQLAPALLPRFVTAAATTSSRARAMAGVLEQLGATEQAEALLATVG